MGGDAQQQEEDWLGPTWFQRMAGFAICVAGGLVCFMIAFFVGLPLLLIKPSKFATSFTLGSILLKTSLYLNNYFLTIVGTVIEIVALLYYFTSYSPFSGGSIRVGSRMASGLLPI
ncbi:hypothetical protein BKA57DRAFT_470832 [Linnemannia elongata]|nr:hypothetical protein BKA57DRAFT_470832 [Linnemannia elongata]